MKHDLTAQLDAQDKKKFYCPLRVLKHDLTDSRLIAINSDLGRF